MKEGFKMYKSIRYSEMLPKGFDGSKEYDQNKSVVKGFVDAMNKGKYSLNSIYTVLTPVYGGLYGWLNPFGTHTDKDGNKVPVVFYAGKLSKKDRRELKESDNLSLVFRTPTPDTVSGIKIYLETDREKIETTIRKNAQENMGAMILVAMKTLACSEEEAKEVVTEYVENFIIDIQNVTDGLFIPAHEDLLEGLGGADFDTDRGFIVIDAKFVKAVGPKLETNIRDFDSFGVSTEKKPVDFSDPSVVNVVLDAPFVVAQGTDTSVGTETSKIDWLITMASLAKSSNAEDTELATRMYMTMCKALYIKPNRNSQIKYVSVIKRNNFINELGFSVNRAIISVHHYNAVLKAMKECAPTPYNIRTIAQDLERLCTFIADGVIDKAKKEYEVSGLKIGFGIFINKQACELYEDKETGTVGVKEFSKAPFELDNGAEMVWIDSIPTKITKLCIKYINSIVGNLKASSKVNLKAHEIGAKIYGKLGLEKRNVLRTVINYYYAYCSDTEDFDDYESVLEVTRAAVCSLVDTPNKVFPLLYYFCNRDKTRCRYTSTPFQVAGPYIADYIFGTDTLEFKCIELEECDMVQGKEVSVVKYGLSKLLKSAYVDSYTEIEVVDGYNKKVTKYSVKGERIDTNFDTSALVGFVLNPDALPEQELNAEFLRQANNLLRRVLSSDDLSSLDTRIDSDDVYFSGDVSCMQRKSYNMLHNVPVKIYSTVHTHYAKHFIGTEGFAEVNGSYFVLIME